MVAHQVTANAASKDRNKTAGTQGVLAVFISGGNWM